MIASSLPHTPVALAQLLLTRFCHDITGPVGAIHNGVEFFHDNADMQDQAIELIGQSAHQALVRIQLFRYLYGMLKEHGNADSAEKYQLVQHYYEGSKVTLQWEQPHLTMTHEECRLFLNLLTMMASCLIRGGTCEVQKSEQPRAMRIALHGTHIRMEDKLRDAILHPQTHIPDTHTIHAYYAALLAQQLEATITLDVQETSASLNLVWSNISQSQ